MRRPMNEDLTGIEVNMTLCVLTLQGGCLTPSHNQTLVVLFFRQISQRDQGDMSLSVKVV